MSALRPGRLVGSGGVLIGTGLLAGGILAALTGALHRRLVGGFPVRGGDGVGLRRLLRGIARGAAAVAGDHRGDDLAQAGQGDAAVAHDDRNAAGAVDDRGGHGLCVGRALPSGVHALGARAVLQVDAHRVAEHLAGLLGGHGGCHAGAVGRGHGQRPGLLQKLLGHGIVGHAQRDRAAGLAQIPLQGRLRVADERQSAGPEGSGQGAGLLRDGVREPVEHAAVGDEHGRGHGAIAALGLEQALHGLGRERVGRDAVDGVGGHHDDLVAGQLAAGGIDSGAARALVLDAEELRGHRRLRLLLGLLLGLDVLGGFLQGLLGVLGRDGVPGLRCEVVGVLGAIAGSVVHTVHCCTPPPLSTPDGPCGPDHARTPLVALGRPVRS